MERRITVRAIIVREEKLLCVRQKDYETGEPWDFWCLPGGKLDPGEALVPALRREMLEETNIAPEIGNLLYIQQFSENGVESLEFFFHVTNAEDYTAVDLSDTTHGEAEIEEIDFVTPEKVTILPKFLATEPLDKITDATQPVKIFSDEL